MSKDSITAEGATADPDKEQEKGQASEGSTPAAKNNSIKFCIEWLREFP